MNQEKSKIQSYVEVMSDSDGIKIADKTGFYKLTSLAEWLLFNDFLAIKNTIKPYEFSRH